jgi:hypothetical protein
MTRKSEGGDDTDGMGNIQQVQQVGKCVGCGEFGKLDDGACNTCLTDPQRGRKWTKIAEKIRVDPALAAKVYWMIKTDGGREIFSKMFGTPSDEALAVEAAAAEVRAARKASANECEDEDEDEDGDDKPPSRPGLRLVN